MKQERGKDSDAAAEERPTLPDPAHPAKDEPMATGPHTIGETAVASNNGS